MKQEIKIHFLGAAGTVTGSKTLVETSQYNVLIDAGMFQGLKELRLRNWENIAFDASKIDVILLTHGHLDHTGYLPRLVQQGFAGTILATAPTLSIAEIILRDSAKIHEEEAEKANKEKYSKHVQAKPFYTVKETAQTISLFKTITVGKWTELAPAIKCRFRLNGHIIGSTFIELDVFGKIMVFSGDLGRLDDPLLAPPEKPRWADYLFLESTYGNKLHPKESVSDTLIDLIQKTIRERGTLIIPSFAVERLQLLMYLLWRLYQANKIPNIDIYIDSPMGNNVLNVFEQFMTWHQLTAAEFHNMVNRMRVITSYRETWETIDDPKPKIVIAGSGMVTGGRVLTYLKQLIDKHNTSILLVGYQAEGTRGRQLLEGAHEIKFFGKYYPVKAQVHQIESLSAHADQLEILNWLDEIVNVPEDVFLVHGEPTALDALRVKLHHTQGWKPRIPKLGDIVKITIESPEN